MDVVTSVAAVDAVVDAVVGCLAVGEAAVLMSVAVVDAVVDAVVGCLPVGGAAVVAAAGHLNHHLGNNNPNLPNYYPECLHHPKYLHLSALHLSARYRHVLSSLPPLHFSPFFFSAPMALSVAACAAADAVMRCLAVGMVAHLMFCRPLVCIATAAAPLSADHTVTPVGRPMPL